MPRLARPCAVKRHALSRATPHIPLGGDEVGSHPPPLQSLMPGYIHYHSVACFGATSTTRHVLLPVFMLARDGRAPSRVILLKSFYGTGPSQHDPDAAAAPEDLQRQLRYRQRPVSPTGHDGHTGKASLGAGARRSWGRRRRLAVQAEDSVRGWQRTASGTARFGGEKKRARKKQGQTGKSAITFSFLNHSGTNL